jgi:hypothetical protein
MRGRSIANSGVLDRFSRGLPQGSPPPSARKAIVIQAMEQLTLYDTFAGGGGWH